MTRFICFFVLQEHRSAVDILVENVTSDKDDDVDDESDIVADCSYTQLLEGNSAYGRLCEQASNIKIGMLTQTQAQKVANIYENVAPMRTASLAPKDIGVFHQVIKPSAFSKGYGFVLNRKRFDLSLKDKTGVAVSVQGNEEDESKNAESDAAFKPQDGSVGDENVDKTSEFTDADGSVEKESVSETDSSKEVSQTDEDSQDAGLTIVEEENITSKSLSEDESSVAEHEIPHPDLHDHTNKCDSHVDELKDKLVEEQNESINARDDDSSVVTASPSSVKETDTEEPVEETDERCTVEEEMQECQSKSEEMNEQDGSDAERKTSTAVAERLDVLAVDQKDNTDNVDMEISDEEFDDNAAIDAHELNTPSVKSFVSVNSEVKMKESEAQAEQPEEANPGDDARDEIHSVSHSDDVTSSCHIMSVEEKIASAFNSDTVVVMKSGSENVTLEQNVEVQEAHELCENEPTHDTESSKSDGEHKERDDNESQTYSCEDKAQDAHQKCPSPKISASSPNSTTTPCEETVAPQASKKTDGEINSMYSTCSTPTQDEVAYNPELRQNFIYLKEASNRDLHCTDNTDRDITERSSVSPRSHVHTKTSLSDFVGRCEETASEGWRKSKYKSPRDKPDIWFKDKLSPIFQQKDEQVVVTEGASQHDSELSYRDYDADEKHGSYHLSDEPWSYLKTDESDSQHFDEDYPFDYSDASYPAYTPEVSEDSYEPKTTKKKNYKSQSTLDDASWRGDRFRCQTKVTYVPQYATDNLGRIPEKRSRTDNAEWNEDSLSCTVDYSVRKTSHHTPKPTRKVTVNSLSHGRKSKQRFDWRRYFRRVSTWDDSDSEGRSKFDVPPSSIITVLDKKGSRVTFDNSPAMKPPVDSKRMTTRPEGSSNQDKVDLIQSAVDLEYLIFSEQLNCILKDSKRSLRSLRRRSDSEHGAFPVTVRFSNLDVESLNDVERPSLTEMKIKVDLSERKGTKRKQKHFCETDRMNDVWTVPRQTEAMKKKWDSRQPGSSGSDAVDNLHDHLSFTVQQECNVRYRFYILVTSADTFFEETKVRMFLLHTFTRVFCV